MGKSDQPAKPAEKIIRDVMDLVIQGHSQADIRDFVASEYGQDPQPIIEGVFEYFGKLAQQDPSRIVGFVLESYRDLYRQSVAVGDLANAAKCLKEIRDTAIKLADYEFDDA